MTFATGYYWSVQQLEDPPDAQGTIYANSINGIV